MNEQKTECIDKRPTNIIHPWNFSTHAERVCIQKFEFLLLFPKECQVILTTFQLSHNNFSPKQLPALPI